MTWTTVRITLAISVFCLAGCSGKKPITVTYGLDPPIDPVVEAITPQPVPPPPPPVIQAKVQTTATDFRVRNLDEFDWTDCTIRLNSKAENNGYTIHLATIRARKLTHLGTMEFANSNGERFNPFTLKPKTVDIDCNTPQGRAEDHFYFEDNAQRDTES
jgi:hypothetical protein